MAAVIAGCWAYCLVVAPLLSERSYGEVVAEKSKDIGLGFTLAALLIGVMWLFVARENRPNDLHFELLPSDWTEKSGTDRWGVAYSG